MNYFVEIKAFYDRMDSQPLSTNAIVVWHALMHINNRLGWLQPFTTTLQSIENKTSISHRAIRNARKELTEKGLIQYDAKKGIKATSYKMISLTYKNRIENGQAFNGQFKDNMDKQYASYSTGHLNEQPEEYSLGHLNNQLKGNCDAVFNEDNNEEMQFNSQIEEQKNCHFTVDYSNDLGGHIHYDLPSALTNIDNTQTRQHNDCLLSKRLHQHFVLSFGLEPSKIQLQSFKSYHNQHGFDEELVCYAMRLSSDRKKSYKYALGILQQWLQNKIRTVADAKLAQQKFFQQSKRKKDTEMRGDGKDERSSTWTEGNDEFPPDFKFYR